MILRSTDVRAALRARQRGFILDPFRFGVAPATDPYFADVVLLIIPSGTAGSTTFTDLSNSPQTISVGGSAPQHDGAGGITFTGSAGCYLTGSAAKMDCYTLPFTVEGFVNPTSVTATQGLYSGFPSHPEVLIETGQLYGHCTNTSLDLASSASAIAAGVLQHWAFTLDGAGDAFLHVDGVTKAGPTPSAGTDTGTTWALGARWGSGSFNLRLTGTHGALRITKGVARYGSSNFTPPASFPTS